MALPIIGVGGKLTSPVLVKTPRFLPYKENLNPHVIIGGNNKQIMVSA